MFPAYLTCGSGQPHRCCVRRPARSRLRRIVFHCLLLLVSLACVLPLCVSTGSRQQHNVWYNGLFISGIAVDERTGDVFFSDAAGNRIIHQSRTGKVLAELKVYDGSGLHSPTQLAYSGERGKLYVATGAYNKVAAVDVASGEVTFSTSPSYLSSATALSIHNGTGHVLVVDSWGLQVEVWEPHNNEWTYHSDLSTAEADTPPTYFASGSMMAAEVDETYIYLSDPTQPLLYPSVDTTLLTPISTLLGSTAVQNMYVDFQTVNLYVLSQPQPDGPMHVQLIDSTGTPITNWTAPGTGGAAVPFYGWAMHVDSNGSMYVSDHGVDAVSSPYGRIVKLAANGSEAGSWSMSDGVAYAFSSIGYSEGSTQGGSCAFWMADSERGMVRVSAEGALLVPFDAAPVDSVDERAARFTGMALDTPIPMQDFGSTFVLLDTSSPTSTKLWRYQPYNQFYELLDTTSVQLGAHITGVAVDPNQHGIYVSDTRTRTVIRLFNYGVLDTMFNTSGVGFVEPGGLALLSIKTKLYVADSAYNGTGAVIQVDALTGSKSKLVLNSTQPPMFRPLSLTYDSPKKHLYVADSNGYVFQIAVASLPYTQLAVHQAVPTARSIVSMTVGARGVYMVDSYSRRLVILSFDTAVWTPGSNCISPTPPSSSSSSSSTGSSSPPDPLMWSVAAVLVAAVAIVVALAGGATWLCMRWKGRQGWRGRRRKEAGERLWAVSECDEEAKEAEEEAEVEVEEAEYVDDKTQDQSLTQPPVSDDEADAAASRFDYYVARYEVVAMVRDMEQLDDGRQHQAHRSIGQPHALRASLTTAQPSGTSPPSACVSSTTASPATSDSAHSASESSLASYSSTSPDDDSATAAASSSALPAPVSVSVSGLSSPRRIAELQAAWPTSLAPTFISSVTDLTILGEGSSGVVYRGVYRGQACVVKLAKSAALTSLAWREWQCHLCLPPHRHLVRFLGALPMSSTSYLVLVFVRQGSLHSLLCSSQAARSVYSRPYSVMRCMRDMCAALHHIHLSGIVHRDVSCRNILVDSDGCMVLCDLGLAIQLQWRHDRLDSDTSAQSRQATLLHVQDDSLQTAVPVRWTSPESLASSHYSTHSDVWSLGVAVWEMTAGGALPYADTQHSTGACIRQIVARQLTLHIHEQWGREHTLSRAEQQLADRVRRLTHAALQYDVQQRPDSHTMQQAVESEWNEWQAEWASEADELHDWWAAYHAEVQRRLGPPCRYDD